MYSTIVTIRQIDPESLRLNQAMTTIVIDNLHAQMKGLTNEEDTDTLDKMKEHFLKALTHIQKMKKLCYDNQNSKRIKEALMTKEEAKLLDEIPTDKFDLDKFDLNKSMIVIQKAKDTQVNNKTTLRTNAETQTEEIPQDKQPHELDETNKKKQMMLKEEVKMLTKQSEILRQENITLKIDIKLKENLLDENEKYIDTAKAELNEYRSKIQHLDTCLEEVKQQFESHSKKISSTKEQTEKETTYTLNSNANIQNSKTDLEITQNKEDAKHMKSQLINAEQINSTYASKQLFKSINNLTQEDTQVKQTLNREQIADMISNNGLILNKENKRELEDIARISQLSESIINSAKIAYRNQIAKEKDNKSKNPYN